MGSEEGVAWDFVSLAAETKSCVVYTQSYYKEILYKGIDQSVFHNIEIRFFSLPSWLETIRLKLPQALGYLIWHFFLTIHLWESAKQFKICHVVTWANGILPITTLLLPTKVIWGPIAGFERVPLSFFKAHSRMSQVKEAIRDYSILLAKYNPILRLLYQKVTHIFVATDEARDYVLNNKLKEESELTFLPAISISEDLVQKGMNKPQFKGDTFEIIVATRLIPWKGVDLLIESICHLDFKNEITLNIYGEGSYKEELLTMVSQMGVSEVVRFNQKISQSELFNKISNSDLFVLPSLHDSGAGVCAEAIALKTPVITTSFGGVKANLRGAKGLRLISGRNREELIKALSVALQNAYEEKAQNTVEVPSLPEDSLLLRENRRKIMNEFYV